MRPQSEGRITTQEQATQVVRGFCAEAIIARDLCDVEVPGDKEATVKFQNQQYQKWLMSYGAAVGALTCLHRAGLISDNAFEKLSHEVYATLQPKVVGNLSNPVSPSDRIVLA